MDYKTILPEQLNENFFKNIAKDWMLISAYDKNHDRIKYNTMTASWGGIGFMWNKSIFWCVIRPQRFTREFVEKSELITFSFFDEKYHDSLKYCGSHSGKNSENKIIESGLTPIIGEMGDVDYEQSRLTIVAKKIYVNQISESNFYDKELIESVYPQKDFHYVYVCEIKEVRVY